MDKEDLIKVKDIICKIVEELESLCNDIPNGRIKNIICGIVSILELICSNL